jgi:peptide/nickel transport system substrate-binding protein
MSWDIGRKRKLRFLVSEAGLAVALVFSSLPVLSPAPAGAVPSAPAGAALSSLPRDETLYTSGTSYAPPASFNPLESGAYTGTDGLLYEPLFLYDPLHGKFLPWLARSGAWSGPATYRLQLRPGVDWVDSSTGAVVGTLSGEDVAFTVRLAMSDPSDPAHKDVASVRGVSSSGLSVTVQFVRPVRYAAWQRFLWHAPILPAAVWPKVAPSSPNTAPVATGPMLLYSTSPKGACYRDNPHWWARSALGLRFKFSYLCDLVSPSSGAGLADLLDDHVDWSNQLLRGVPNLTGSKAAGYGIKTYYPSAPYMIPASTAWLQMDLARPPMSSLDFRLGVAYALDPSAVAQDAYTGTVAVASPSGLLPELSSWVDTKAERKFGFHYSPALAKKYLSRSGYKGRELRFFVPQGQSDLDDAAHLLAAQLAKVGVRVYVEAVSPAVLTKDLSSGNYDMVVNPEVGISPNPWEYFDTIYRLPLPVALAAGENTERFKDPGAWSLVQQAATTPTSDKAELTKLYDELQVDFLRQLPEIPLWYTGAWFQANTRVWEGYPSATSKEDQYTPVMWHGWLGSTTTVLALAALRRR